MTTLTLTGNFGQGINSKSMSNKPRKETAEEKKLREFQEQALPYMAEFYPKALAKSDNNRQDADDLIQETFAKAYRYWHTFQQGTNLGGWLYTIMDNTSKNRKMKAGRLGFVAEFDAMEDFQLGKQSEASQPLTSRSAETAALAGLTSKQVTEALEKLNPSFRNVVQLAILEGYSYKEISEMLNMEMGTVMSSLHRGKKKLRELLYEYASEEGYDVGEVAAEMVAKQAAKGKKK